MYRKYKTLNKKLNNIKRTKQKPTKQTTKQNKEKNELKTKQNIYKRYIQDSKSINLSEIKINNKNKIILAADNKQN